MPRVKLTAAKIRTLATEQNDELFLDETLHGFAVRVRATGAKTFAYYYKRGGKTRRCKIGTVSANVTDVEVATARKTAKTLAAQVQLGGDPAVERQQKIDQAADTFGKLVEKYLEFQKTQVRESTLTEIKRHLEKHAKPLHKSPLYAVDLKAIADRLNVIAKNNGEIAANRVRANMSAMFSWAMGEGHAKLNPVAPTNKRKETARDRVLTDDEVRTIWNAAGADHFGVIVKVLLLTAQRRTEIAALRWDEMDFDKRIITLPTERTKNGERHTIPMSDTVHDLLKGLERKDGRPFVFGYRDNPFSGFSKSKRDLDRKALDGLRKLGEERGDQAMLAYVEKIKSLMARIAEAKDDEKKSLSRELNAIWWTLHDLRRTADTGMNEIDIRSEVVEAILNHKSGHKAGVAGIYNHAKYASHKVDALTRWDDHITAIVTSKPSIVTPIKKRA
jgi:integrase